MLPWVCSLMTWPPKTLGSPLHFTDLPFSPDASLACADPCRHLPAYDCGECPLQLLPVTPHAVLVDQAKAAGNSPPGLPLLSPCLLSQKERIQTGVVWARNKKGVSLMGSTYTNMDGTEMTFYHLCQISDDLSQCFTCVPLVKVLHENQCR